MTAEKKPVNINLVLKKTEDSYSGQIIAWALSYGRYIIIITQIIVLSVFFARFKLDRDHDDLQELVSQKQSLVASLSDLENEIRTTQKKLVYISDISNNQNLVTGLMVSLQDKIPSDTTLSNLTIKTNKLLLKGTVANLRSFNYLLTIFQQDKKYEDVLLNNISREVDGRIEFQIQAELNPKFFN